MKPEERVELAIRRVAAYGLPSSGGRELLLALADELEVMGRPYDEDELETLRKDP